MHLILSTLKIVFTTEQVHSIANLENSLYIFSDHCHAISTLQYFSKKPNNQKLFQVQEVGVTPEYLPTGISHNLLGVSNSHQEYLPVY